MRAAGRRPAPRIPQVEGVLDFLAQYPGPGAFVLLVACGLGLPPWSEEVVTVGVGYFVYKGHIAMLPALVWCWGGLLAGDSVVYWLGDHIGERVYRWPLLRRHLGAKRRMRFNRFFLKHGTKTVLAARFIPGFRILAYFVAGNLRMPYWKFFALDSLGAAIYAPAGVVIGYLAGGNLDDALKILRRVEIPLAILGGLGLIWVVRSWGRGRKDRLAALRRIRAQRQAKRAARRRKEASERPGKPPADPGGADGKRAGESELRMADGSAGQG